MSSYTNCEYIEPQNPKKISASIIWLHGLGANAKDFIGLPERLGLTETVRFVLPNAPIRPISINQNLPMQAWYNIYDLSLQSREDKLGISQSVKIVNSLIEQEINLGITPDKIILGGFSQGAALSLYAGLRTVQNIAGIVCLSGYLLLQQEYLEFNRQIIPPIFIGHGLFDPIVPLYLGQQMHAQVQKYSSEVTLNTYPMEHTITEQLLNDVARFIQKILHV